MKTFEALNASCRLKPLSGARSRVVCVVPKATYHARAPTSLPNSVAQRFYTSNPSPTLTSASSEEEIETGRYLTDCETTESAFSDCPEGVQVLKFATSSQGQSECLEWAKDRVAFDALLLDAHDAMYRLELQVQQLIMHILAAWEEAVGQFQQRFLGQVVPEACQHVSPAPATPVQLNNNHVEACDAKHADDVEKEQAYAAPRPVFTTSSMSKSMNRKLQTCVQISPFVSPVATIMEMSAMQRLGVLVALFLSAALPRWYKAFLAKQKQERKLAAMNRANANLLKHQKQRFRQALEMDSVNLELPDIKEAPVDPNNAAAGPTELLEAPVAKEWEEFVAASKVQEVRDIWDANQHDGTVPHVSKKKLEEMTARVRTADKEEGRDKTQKVFISFEELCMGNEDFDAQMAERVAQRKARFKGQFLEDADVGLPSAPKRRSAALPGATEGTAPGNGRLGAEQGAGRRRSNPKLDALEPSRSAAEGPLLEVRPKRRQDASAPATTFASDGTPLLEIRPKRRPQADQQGSSSPTTTYNSDGTPLLEIRPRRKQLPAADAQESSASSLESHAEQQSSTSEQTGPAGTSSCPSRPGAGDSSPRQQQLHASDGSGAVGTAGRMRRSSLDEDDFQRSLRQRSKLEYVHPSLAQELQQGRSKSAGGVRSPQGASGSGAGRSAMGPASGSADASVEALAQATRSDTKSPSRVDSAVAGSNKGADSNGSDADAASVPKPVLIEDSKVSLPVSKGDTLKSHDLGLMVADTWEEEENVEEESGNAARHVPSTGVSAAAASHVTASPSKSAAYERSKVVAAASNENSGNGAANLLARLLQDDMAAVLTGDFVQVLHIVTNMPTAKGWGK